MSVMLKLRLQNPNPELEEVLSLPGIRGLEFDREFGLVCIDPQERLFVIRVREIGDIQARMTESPEILGIYGDPPISGVERQRGKETKDNER